VHLIFSGNFWHCLACHKDTGEMALLAVGPLVLDWLAQVEEPSHG
jgi:hypothetical protein